MVAMGNLKTIPGMLQNGQRGVIWFVCVFVLLVFTQGVCRGANLPTPTDSDWVDLGSLSCGNPISHEIESPDSSSNVNGNQYQYFRFKIDTPGDVEIYTELDADSNMNPKGTLYWYQGNYDKIISDNNGGVGKNFLIQKNLNSSGYYYLVVNGPHLSGFNLYISFPDSGNACGGCMDIEDIPLTTQIESAPPLLMFLLDDSGSMDFDILCDTDSGLFHYGDDGNFSAYLQEGDSNISTNDYNLDDYAKDVQEYWVTQWSGYNKVYYNPEVNYSAWPLYEQANKDKAYKHPVFNELSANNSDPDYGHRDMDSNDVFAVIDGKTLRYAHYYVKSGDTVYLVNLDSTGVEYYKVETQDEYYKVEKLTAVQESATELDDIRITYPALALKNMANWYQYSRNRELAAKGAVAKVISGVSGVKIGLHSINHGNLCEVEPINVDDEDRTEYVLRLLYNLSSKGGTELRSALYEIGEYYEGDSDIGDSPYATAAEGGTCQQAFTIVMTDGYYNGDEGFNMVGNADADSGAETDESSWDGVPYADADMYVEIEKKHKTQTVREDTLADIAMYFYERDLRPNLDNSVPVSAQDQANHQHMVTYTVAFGVTGTLTPSLYDCPATSPGSDDPASNCPGDTNDSDMPAWPIPTTDKKKIDDLFHAAVNGRGKFFSAGNSELLVAALLGLMEDIQDRLGTGASVTTNSQQLKTDSQLYQGSFDSAKWSGDLKAYALSEGETGLVTTTEAWSAQDVFKTKSATWWSTDRNIITIKGTSGTGFRYDNLTDSQKAYLTGPQVSYIRGDSSGEESNAQGTFRDRDGLILGDIVNSSPVYENGVVYVGANDGMLHAFDATDGSELFAYIPSFVLGALSNLTEPEYSHRYYVNNTVYIRTVTSGDTATTWLVGGLGKGGRGYYGIDITTPLTIGETAETIPDIWEYPAAGEPDPDMGYSYSMPVIVKANNGENVILFGNGYDSPTSKAFLYVLSLDGTLLQKIPTGVGSPVPEDDECNGLSTPVPIDLNYDGTMDVVYAGDLLGNMWKFDLSGDETSSWGVAYAGLPLFTAKNNDGDVQPIVAKPAVMTHCDATRKGVMLIFGTGRYLSEGDTTSTNTQSIYGIWDWEDEWDASDLLPLGRFGQNTVDPAARTLPDVNLDGVNLTLLKQSVTSGVSQSIISDANPINWFSPSDWNEGAIEGLGTHMGWYMDLVESGERVITKTQLIDGNAVVVSMTPKSSPCTAGGGSAIYLLDACSGGKPNEALFDTNGDGLVNALDDIRSGKRFLDDIYYAPAIVNNAGGDTDKVFFGKDEQMTFKKEVLGLYYWRFVE